MREDIYYGGGGGIGMTELFEPWFSVAVPKSDILTLEENSEHKNRLQLDFYWLDLKKIVLLLLVQRHFVNYT